MKVKKIGNVVVRGSQIEITDWEVEGGSGMNDLARHARFHALWVIIKSFFV